MSISSREELIDALNIAAELEHGVAVQYLFAAFAMKKSTRDGLKPHQEGLVKSWEQTILSVAREEMGHLGTVCNLLSAIGAAPHFGRPNFPQPQDTYYPFEVKLSRLSDETIYRFIRFELPKDAEPPAPPTAMRGIQILRAPVEYHFVDQLYGGIREAFCQLDNLFVGPRSAQDTDTWSHRMKLLTAQGRKTASEAIDSIILDGEGSPGHREGSHYAAFLEIRKQLEDEIKADPAFDPSHKVVDNPRTVETHPDAPTRGSYITNERTRRVAELFNDVYEIAILLLIQYYSFGGESAMERREIQNAAREIMSVAIRPLGEILVQLPVLDPDDGSKAGAPFEFYSTPRLPPQPKPRWQMLLERLQNTSDGLAAEAQHHPQGSIKARLASIAEKLCWIRQNIRALLVQEFVLKPERPESQC